MTSSDRGAEAGESPRATAGEVSGATERLFQHLLDYGEKLICVLLFAAFVVRLSPSLMLRPMNAVVVISNGLLVYFVLIRRSSTTTTRPMDWVFALLGTTLPLMLRPGGHPLAPPALGGALGLVGIAISIWAKLTLRRSFGLAAANRGVVDGGPYRLVRHPMYVGYLLADLGFLLNNPIAGNVSIYVAALLCQVARVLAEERLLRADPRYQEVIRRTPFRLAPGLF